MGFYIKISKMFLLASVQNTTYSYIRYYMNGEKKKTVFIIVRYSPVSKNLNIKIYKTIILPVVPYGCETWFL